MQMVKPKKTMFILISDVMFDIIQIDLYSKISLKIEFINDYFLIISYTITSSLMLKLKKLISMEGIIREL